MNRTRTLVVLLVALTIVNISWTAAVDSRTANLASDVDGVERNQSVIAAAVGANGSLDGESSVNVSLYAYDENTDDARAVPTRVVAVPANGLYVDVRDVTHGVATQRATQRAWAVANGSDTPPAYRGGIVRIHPPESWNTVGGGSAALGVSLGFAATNPCVSLNRSVAATGGLDTDGTVRRVGHVEEKAIAAREDGVRTLLVPNGQRVSVPGIEVVGVQTFEAAAQQMLQVEQNCSTARQTVA